MKTLAKNGINRRRQTAFTLLELLVVIAIIALLAAVLMPVLANVRARADSTKCVSNLHQIGAGISLFVADHDGYLPGPIAGGVHAYYSKTDVNTVSLTGNRRLAALLQGYIAPPIVSNASLLSPVFLCPAFARQMTVDVNSLPYLSNNSVGGVHPFGHASSDVDSQQRPMRLGALAAVSTKQLSEVWLMKDLDADASGAYPGQCPLHPVHPVYKEVEHGGGAAEAVKAHPGSYRNALFFDFHVGRLTLDDKPL